MADLDARGETVPEQAPGFGFQDGKEVAVGHLIFRGAMHGGGELALQVRSRISARERQRTTSVEGPKTSSISEYSFRKVSASVINRAA